ncbi:DUF4446 family protein [Jatrophihabitans sp. YIM 134969]
MLLTVVAICALVLAYVALVAAWLALRTLGRIRRAGALGRTTSPASSSAALATQIEARLAGVEAEIANTRRSAAARSRTGERDTHTALDSLRADVSASLRRVALVRYDAFGDHGGRLSFSLALLDDTGDGVTLTSIAGRHETRVYAKGVSAGEGDRELSPEETQAVRAAMRQQPGAAREAS